MPPPLAVREPSLDADDLAVMKALLDGRLRPRRDGALASAAAAESRFLVVNTTMAACPRDPAPLGPEPGRCMDPSWVRLVSDVVAPDLSRAVLIRFPERNTRRLAIDGPLGDDVILVSATLVDSMAPGELLRQYPAGSEIVTLSAPVYPGARVAAMAFAAGADAGAARLEREMDGRWRVAGKSVATPVR
jgi:hypothetical protein